MREISQRWAPPPDRSGPLVERAGLEIAWVPGLRQTLVSGELAAARRELASQAVEVGLLDLAKGDAAFVRIARDRALLVDSHGPGVAGWQAGGYATTPVDDGWAVLDLAGEAAAGLVAQAAPLDLAQPSPSRSAALLFAGCWCLLYLRDAGCLRVHVEAPFAPYLAAWMVEAAGAAVL